MTGRSRPAVDRAEAQQRQQIRARLHVAMRTADRLGLRDLKDSTPLPPAAKVLPLEYEVRQLTTAVPVLSPRAAAEARRDLAQIIAAIAAVRQRRGAATSERQTLRHEAGAERTWRDVRTGLAMALNDQWTDDIRIQAAGSDTVLWVDRVLDGAGFCVAWTVVFTVDHAARLEDSGWTLWRPDRPVETRKKRGRVTAADFATYRALVATIRAASISMFATAVCEAMGRAGADPAQVVISTQECGPAEHRRRMDALGVVERTSGSSGRARSGAVLTHCLGCGRPLTDHGSARAGYGPVCAGKVTGSRRLGATARPDVATVFRVAGKPIHEWRDQVACAAERRLDVGAR